MNPLVNTDVHRYVKNLIDRHIPDEDRKDDPRSGMTEQGAHRPHKEQPANTEKGKTQ